MSLFRQEILSEYRRDDRIKRALNGTQLYNLDEFLEWYYPDVRSSPRIQSINRTLDVARINNERREKSDDVLRLLPRMCTAAVKKSYGVSGINNLLTRKNEYDVIFAVSAEGLRSELTSRTKIANAHDNQKLDAVVGFIITELGECGVKPNVYSVNLICAIQGKIKGMLLMGAYLYCIKYSNPQVEQEGFLELAGGYSNIPGLISYMRMGFDKVNETCLSPIDNLPMSVDVTTLSDTIIIRRATGLDKRSIPDEESGLYNISTSPLSKADKKVVVDDLIICNNLLYKIQMLTLARVRAMQQQLDFNEISLLNNINKLNNDSAISDLIERRQQLISRAYPRCKKGVCDKVMGMFGFNINTGYGKTKRKKLQNKRKKKSRTNKRKYLPK